MLDGLEHLRSGAITGRRKASQTTESFYERFGEPSTLQETIRHCRRERWRHHQHQSAGLPAVRAIGEELVGRCVIRRLFEGPQAPHPAGNRALGDRAEGGVGCSNSRRSNLRIPRHPFCWN